FDLRDRRYRQPPVGKYSCHTHADRQQRCGYRTSDEWSRYVHAAFLISRSGKQKAIDDRTELSPMNLLSARWLRIVMFLKSCSVSSGDRLCPFPLNSVAQREAREAMRQLVEPDVDPRRGVEREQLAQQQAADDGDAQGMPQLAAGSASESQRHSAQQGRHGGHH